MVERVLTMFRYGFVFVSCADAAICLWWTLALKCMKERVTDRYLLWFHPFQKTTVGLWDWEKLAAGADTSGMNESSECREQATPLPPPSVAGVGASAAQFGLLRRWRRCGFRLLPLQHVEAIVGVLAAHSSTLLRAVQIDRNALLPRVWHSIFLSSFLSFPPPLSLFLSLSPAPTRIDYGTISERSRNDLETISERFRNDRRFQNRPSNVGCLLLQLRYCVCGYFFRCYTPPSSVPVWSVSLYATKRNACGIIFFLPVTVVWSAVAVEPAPTTDVTLVIGLGVACPTSLFSFIFRTLTCWRTAWLPWLRARSVAWAIDSGRRGYGRCWLAGRWLLRESSRHPFRLVVEGQWWKSTVRHRPVQANLMAVPPWAY